MSKPMVSACVFAAKSLEDLWVKIGECVWFIPKFRLSPSRSLLGDAVAIPDGWWISDTFWFQMMEQLWDGWPYPKKQCFDHGIHYHCQHRWMRMCCPNDERDTPMTKFCGYPVKLADPSPFFSSAFLKMKQLHIWTQQIIMGIPVYPHIIMGTFLVIMGIWGVEKNTLRNSTHLRKMDWFTN